MRENVQFRFIGYKIENIQFEMNPAYQDGTNSAENVTVSLGRKVAFHKEKSGVFLVSLTCLLNQQEQASTEVMHPFSLKLRLVGQFEANGAQDSDLESFARINAPAMLYPYLRSAITQVVTMSGFEPVVLPIMNFLEEN